MSGHDQLQYRSQSLKFKVFETPLRDSLCVIKATRSPVNPPVNLVDQPTLIFISEMITGLLNARYMPGTLAIHKPQAVAKIAPT